MCGIIEQLYAGERVSRTSIARTRRPRFTLPPVAAFPARWQLRCVGLLLTLPALHESSEPFGGSTMALASSCAPLVPTALLMPLVMHEARRRAAARSSALSQATASRDDELAFMSKVQRTTRTLHLAVLSTLSASRKDQAVLKPRRGLRALSVSTAILGRTFIRHCLSRCAMTSAAFATKGCLLARVSPSTQLGAADDYDRRD